MILISQNLVNYDIPIPEDAVFRINLAWVNSIEQLKELLTFIISPGFAVSGQTAR